MFKGILPPCAFHTRPPCCLLSGTMMLLYCVVAAFGLPEAGHLDQPEV